MVALPRPRILLSVLARATSTCTITTPFPNRKFIHVRRYKSIVKNFQDNQTSFLLSRKKNISTLPETHIIIKTIIHGEGQHEVGQELKTSVLVNNEENKNLLSVHQDSKIDKGRSKVKRDIERVPLDAVIRVCCVKSRPSLVRPWVRMPSSETSSSGLIIPGRRILTNACSVNHHAQVKIRRRGSQNKYSAIVLDIGTECDLALLTVKEDEFWEGVPNVEFEDSPQLLDSITIAGYPEDRDTTCVAKGVVRRLDTIEYSHGSTILPGIQVDAIVDEGGCGGPVFNNEGKCLGIVLQRGDEDSIAEVIPISVVNHFIQDYDKNGKYTGFPDLGLKWQNMENPSLRELMGMEPNQTGIFINDIEPTSPESQLLKHSDIFLSFDGVKIGNDGTVPSPNYGECVNYSYLVSQKYNGDSTKIEILRDKKKVQLEIKLANHKRRILTKLKMEAVSYYIIAGFVFTTPSEGYLRSQFGHDEESIKFLEKLKEMLESSDKQPVLLSQILAADINDGYSEDDFRNTEVVSLNGNPIKNLKSMAEMIDSSKDEFLNFDLKDGKRIVLQTEKAKESTKSILKTYCIHSSMSKDLKPVDHGQEKELQFYNSNHSKMSF